MQALARARRDASRIALVSAGETPPEVRRFVAAYGLDVQFASYQSAQEAEACVHDLHDRGIETIVGPGLVTDLAASAGMGAVFLYSHASVRKAVDTALEVAYATCRAFRRQRLDNLLQHLRDGVVALDAHGRVEAINERLASALGSNPRPSAARSSTCGPSCALRGEDVTRSRPCAACATSCIAGRSSIAASRRAAC